MLASKGSAAVPASLREVRTMSACTRLALSLLAVVSVTAPAFAQEVYPTKPVTMIVPCMMGWIRQMY